MNRIWPGLAPLIVALSATNASAAVRFELIGQFFATSMSADGTVIAGNTIGDYETFRWTEADGMTPLGRATVPVLGSGAGTPDISADGTRISGTILGADSTYKTQGVWIEPGSGRADPWTETMPPPPPDGGLLDLGYGSAWGLSEDGNVLVGLYWRPGATDGSAHPSKWTEGGGPPIDLGTSGGSGRANDADQDGDVIVGWEENPDFGNWWPTVWKDGVRTNLNTGDGFGEATCVNPAGTVIGGHAFDDVEQEVVGAIWRWNGSGWDEELIGTLPGHHPTFGLTTVNDMTPDGRVMVGYDRRSNPGDATGFLWTETWGLVDATDFLEDNGVALPSGFVVRSLTGISTDGRTICGIGEYVVPPYNSASFLIELDDALAAPTVAVAAPTQLMLHPNPTRAGTTVSFDLPRAGSVGLDVYDSAGRLVRRIADGTPMGAGRHGLSWDGRDRTGHRVAPGVYFVRVNSERYQESKRLVVVR